MHESFGSVCGHVVEVSVQGKEIRVHKVTSAIDCGTAVNPLLRAAHLVETERQGKNVIYRIANRAVAEFWVAIRSLAEDRLVELKMALAQLTSDPRELTPQDRDSLVRMAQAGSVIVLDVRPSAEYEAAHLPYAQSMPIEELKTRLAELPQGKTIVAYCRGPYCLMARDAVLLLKQQGFEAIHLPEGVAEWGMTPVR